MKWSRMSHHSKITIYSWLSRIISSGLQFINLKLFLDYLGIEHYAIIVILISLQSYFMVMDLSIGYSLQNYITKANTKLKKIDIVGSTAFVAVVVSTLILGTFTFIFSNLITEFLFINFKNIKIDFHTLFIFSAAIFMLGTLANLTIRTLYASHQGHIPNIITAIASGTSTILILIATYSHYLNGFKLYVSIVIMAVPNTLLLLIFLLRLYNKYDFSIFKFNIKIAKRLYYRSIHFWLIGLLALLVLQVDYLILAKTVNSTEIVTYNILTKIYSVFYMLFTTALLTLWPVLTEAYHKNEFEKMTKYIKKYILIGMLFYIFVGITVLLLNDFIVDLLTNGKVLLNYPTIIKYTVYQMLGIWVGVFATVLQSIGDTKFLAFWTFIQACITIPLEYFLSLNYGIDGLILALIISFLCTGAVALPLRVKYKLQGTN